MRQITIKLIATLLTIVLCIGCFSACRNNKNQDDNNTSNTENYYENTSEPVNSVMGESTSNTTDDSTNETTNTENKENVSSENKNTETTKDVENSTSKTPTQGTNNDVCSHKSTTLKNKVSATCTKAGYTGDTYCTKCNKKISSGSQIPIINHNTEIRNKKDATTTSEGYTGDKVCKTCGTVVENGQIIPKVENNTPGKVTYTTNNGYKYVVDEGTDITEYSMKQQTKHIDSPYRAAELEILRLCNEERAKNGLAPLTWFEDAYYFTHIRAEEIYIQWGHPRPDWSEWHTVYTDAGVILHCSYAENLAQFQGWTPETVPQNAVDAWMSSPGHRANILNPQYTKMTISLEYGADNFTLCAVQHFFG